MKSNELMKIIHSGQVKDGSKIKVKNELGLLITTIEYKDKKLQWKQGEFDTSYLCDINTEFEIVQNEHIKYFTSSEWDTFDFNQIILANKITEIIEWINKKDGNNESV